MLVFKPYLFQKYEKIKKECIKENKLFEDDLFPANDSSLFRFNKSKKNIVWKRPYEIVRNPIFIADDLTANDLNQGALGDWYFFILLFFLINNINNNNKKAG